MEKLFGVQPGKDDPLWTFDCSALGEPVKFCQFSGSYQTKAVMTLTNGGILILDAGTGKAIKYWPDTRLRYWLSQPRSDSAIFYGLNFETFIELDAANETIVRKVDVKNDLERMTQPACDISVSRLEGDHIYFTNVKGWIGVFDIAAAKIVWTQRLQFRQPTVIPAARENIRVLGNKLYVLDGEGDLHVFERGR